MLPRRRGRRRREDRRRLLGHQIKRIRHVERVEGRRRPVHAQIRGVAQVPEVLQTPTPDAFVHKIVVLAKRIVEVEGLVAEAEEVRLRVSRRWREGGLSKRLETGARPARVQLIFFGGRSGPLDV